MGYHYTTVRMAKMWKADHTKCWWGCGGMELSYTAGRNVWLHLYKNLINSF